MIGGILVKVAFVTCLLSVACYYQHHRRGTAASSGSGGFSTLSLSAMVSHRGSLSLSSSPINSSTLHLELQLQGAFTPLLVSTFYAGQEGSFMLWTMYTSLIGVILLWHSPGTGTSRKS